MTGQQLKNSILQLAIQGKLVPQNPDDEPASELLKRIREEKERLVKEKKIKKEKPLAEISEDEKPFEIPEGWVWCRLGELGSYKKGPFGSALTKSIFVPKSSESVKVYEQKNAIQKDCTLGDYYITNDYFDKMKGFEVLPKDIIISCAGTIGETYIIPEDAPKGIINQALMRARLIDNQIASYWLLFFDYILLTSDSIHGKGSAMKNIPPFDIFKNYPVALPPLSEQHRIVQKIEELMPLVDEYDKAQKELNTLNANLPEALKKSILQEAIQGNLGTNNPDDEPASELLKRIREEKAKLIKEKKIKKEKPLPEISEDEKPFDIPDNWVWCRLGEIFRIWSARRVHESDWRHKGIPFYRAREVGKLCSDGFVDNDLYIDESLYNEFKRTGYPCSDDLLVTAVGTLGKVYVVKSDDKFYFKDGSVLCFGNIAHVNPYYFKYLISSRFFMDMIYSEAWGTTVATMTMVRAVQYLVPLPPLPEQHRIVQKLNEILPKLKDL